MLPSLFLERMQKLLGEEYPQFLNSYENENHKALRLNPGNPGALRISEQGLFQLEPIPWSRYGFYYGEQDQPGRHPYHAAGVYYIQEASAQLPAELLAARPGERVLDLCAAPGGKSTQLAAAMQGRGLLVCNEIHPARAKILSENIERMGIKNALVTNETPQSIEKAFPEYFDRILVDAPCSGEGMFRKNGEACEEWSLNHVTLCASRQDEILDAASNMLRPGGRLVYSTCTFAPEENEGTISRFLDRHPAFTIREASVPDKASNNEDCPDGLTVMPKSLWYGIAPGRADWTKGPARGLEKTIRLWPHKIKGEGHYAAVLERLPGETAGTSVSEEKQKRICKTQEIAEYKLFEKENLFWEPQTSFLTFGEQLYLTPEGLPPLKGLKVLRPGLHLGTLKKNRFEPSHALALALNPKEVHHTWNLSLQEDEDTVWRYLRGETFPAEGEKGWYLITVDGFRLGWGKLVGNVMKNHYPKGLRKNPKI